MAGADYRFLAPSQPERFGDYPAVTNGHTDYMSELLAGGGTVQKLKRAKGQGFRQVFGGKCLAFKQLFFVFFRWNFGSDGASLPSIEE